MQVHVFSQLIIQLSYTVRIPIFWLDDLYHVILGCDEITSLTSLSWCNNRGVNSKLNTPLSLHHGLVYLVYSGFNAVFLCAVYSIWIIKMLSHSWLVNYQDLPVIVHKQLTRNIQYRTRQSLVRYWNFSFIVSELVQVNPPSSLAECANLYLMNIIVATG